MMVMSPLQDLSVRPLLSMLQGTWTTLEMRCIRDIYQTLRANFKGLEGLMCLNIWVLPVDLSVGLSL